MPFLTPGDWEKSRFQRLNLETDNTIIPLYDVDVWKHVIQQRWLFNKLTLSTEMGYDVAPHGILPKKYPVYSKSILNLQETSINYNVWASEKDVKFESGYFWMPFFDGEHLSVDVLVHDNQILWFCAALGTPIGDGRISQWQIDTDIKMPKSIKDFVKNKIYMSYSGALNFETIGGNIISVHSRFTTQWFDFYDPRFLGAVISLYRDKNPIPATKLKPGLSGTSKCFWGKTQQGTEAEIDGMKIDTRSKNNLCVNKEWYKLGYSNERITKPEV